MKRRLIASVLAVMFLSACAAYKIHPGAANQFDSVAFDALVVAHSTIESTKADLAANSFPASSAPTIKTALNALISAYDVADTSYQAYHQAAVAGTATAAQANAVTANLGNLSTAVSALSAAKGTK